MDFIEKLPPSSGYTLILVIVDRLSKQSLFIPTHDTITFPQLAQLFLLHVFSKHGVPKPRHFRLQHRICIPLLLVPRNCIGHETSFHFQIPSKVLFVRSVLSHRFGMVSGSEMKFHVQCSSEGPEESGIQILCCSRK